MIQTKCRILKKEKPIWVVGMSKDRYELAEQYFLDNGIIFSHNGGKTFNHTIHILRCQCLAWSEFAQGNTALSANCLPWREAETAQRMLNELWSYARV